ncbi:hypothetical protein OKW49_006351 [Paraburkholderia youngii]|uniref:hypothetical protein n=1 Tax=Paraburkholderia youngii TaxID=2782701 RepID=UPI003D1A6BB9
MSSESDDEFKAVHQLLKACEADRLSRPTQAEELLGLGKNLKKMMKEATKLYVSRCGDTVGNRRRATSICYDYFQRAMGISQSSARAYIRCYQRFADYPEATRLLTFGELNALAGKEVSHEHIAAIVRARQENPTMTREELVALFRSLRESDAKNDFPAQQKGPPSSRGGQPCERSAE